MGTAAGAEENVDEAAPSDAVEDVAEGVAEVDCVDGALLVDTEPLLAISMLMAMPENCIAIIYRQRCSEPYDGRYSRCRSAVFASNSSTNAASNGCDDQRQRYNRRG